MLDVGTGQGVVLSFVTELGQECHVPDVSDTYVKGIMFQLRNMGADAIPYPAGSFDALTMLSTAFMQS
ncbi:MAG: hypothetical protein HOO98_13055 [Nitrospira sp.]|nr:hypothetical protein [Nitrospira sp.]